MKFSEKVYELCRKIPDGKISTYREIAKKLNTKSYRAVGQALKHNQNPKNIPCFKIVKANGDVGGYSGINPKNISKKIRLLKNEGIKIKDNKVLDMESVLYKFR